MALAEPTGGAGRSTLIDALRRLRQQYAGIDATDPRTAIGNRPSVADPRAAIKNAPAVNPLDYLPGAPPPGTGRTDWTTFNPADYVNGVNRYNKFLGTPVSMGPAPGPIGEGPGFWAVDGFSPSNPFYRSDWVYTGDPNDPWDISGET